MDSENKTWDEYYIDIAEVVKSKSKDQSTQIGAVMVGEDKQIVSTGYNSFPRGIDDNIPERQERPEKYYWMVHAETNAILNAALNGTKTKGSVMYMTCGIPCADCARNIISVGVKEIICKKDQSIMSDESMIKWEEGATRSIQMFKEAGVIIRYWDL